MKDERVIDITITNKSVELLHRAVNGGRIDNMVYYLGVLKDELLKSPKLTSNSVYGKLPTCPFFKDGLLCSLAEHDSIECDNCGRGQ